NAIDWGTRPPANLWQDKIAVLLSASPGSLGGARGLIQVRTILSGIKTWVIPEQVQLSAAHEAFGTPGGTLKVEGVHKQIQGAIQSLEVFTKKMLP
ncbi:MAG: NADPH-dependent FMN reductase, partial [Bdellovibrionota bacterium]